MTKEFTEEQLYQIFFSTFNEEPDKKKLGMIVQVFGIEKVSRVFKNFITKGVHPPAPGRRNNPYALIFKVCNEWNFDH